MWREIRKVPEDHKHDMKNGRYIPMLSIEFYDKYYKWISREEFYDGHWDDEEYYNLCMNQSSYHKKWSYYQLYENVSDGTPLSPAFKTQSELKNWLINNLDYWGNQWQEKSIDSILQNWSALSGIITYWKFIPPHQQ